jgi:hypothetical protein
VEGEPVQIITPSQSVSVEVIDLSDQAEAEREAKARSLTAEEAWRPSNLSQGPLLRVKLLRLGEQDHILVLTLHHIVSDGWSMGVMHREHRHCTKRSATTGPRRCLSCRFNMPTLRYGNGGCILTS